MKVYEEIIKDLDSFTKFIVDNDFAITCDICDKYGLGCAGRDCTNNTVKYLQMDIIEENTPEGELPQEEFNKFINDYIRKLADKINDMDTYVCINYTRNHIEELEEKGIIFNSNQRELLSKEFKRIESAINHLESLKSTIDKYK